MGTFSAIGNMLENMTGNMMEEYNKKPDDYDDIEKYVKQLEKEIKQERKKAASDTDDK